MTSWSVGPKWLCVFPCTVPGRDLHIEVRPCAEPLNTLCLGFRLKQVERAHSSEISMGHVGTWSHLTFPFTTVPSHKYWAQASQFCKEPAAGWWPISLSTSSVWFPLHLGHSEQQPGLEASCPDLDPHTVLVWLTLWGLWPLGSQ